MKCKVCNKTYRKGVIASVMTDKGLKGARVCQSCAKDGILLVAAVPLTKCLCGAPAVKCVACVKTDPDARVRNIAQNLRTQIKAAKLFSSKGDPECDELEDNPESFRQGKIEGMENALAALMGKTS